MKMKKKKLFAKRRYTRSRGGDIAVLTFLILFGLFSIIPMVYSVITSFKPLDELLLYPPKFMVSRPTLEMKRDYFRWSGYHGRQDRLA